jgi:hypothetical protein
MSLRLDRILLAAPIFEDDLIVALIGVCRAEHVKLSVVPPAREQVGAGVQVVHVAELPVLEYNTSGVRARRFSSSGVWTSACRRLSSCSSYRCWRSSRL